MLRPFRARSRGGGARALLRGPVGPREPTRTLPSVPPLAPSDFDKLEVEQARELAQRAGVVADAEGAVVRRSLLAPCVHESRWRQGELQAAVGVPDPQRRSGQRLPLGGEHLEVALAGLSYGKDGGRPGPDAELHGDTVAGLAVVDP